MIMDHRLLLLLETIEGSHSISEAAQKLYLTQPYVSREIKKSEKQYNVLLIDRASSPIELTPAGHLLIKYLRNNLHLENQLRIKLKKYAHNHFSTLRMGISPPLGENFNLAILPKLLTAFPNLKTETVEITTLEAEKAFKDNKLDLYVGNPVHLSTVNCKSLHKDQQVLVLGKNSHLYQPNKREIVLRKGDFQKIDHEDFIMVDGESHYQEIIDNYFREIGIHFYPRIHVRDSHTALELANKGMGNMTTCIEPMGNKKYDNINYIKLPIDQVKIDFTISTVKSRSDLSSEIEFVEKIVQQVFTTEILIF